MSDDLTQEQIYDIPDDYQPLPWHRGFGRQVGPLFEKRDGDGLTRAFRVGEHHTNGMMNAHGGMLMTFADMAWGSAVEKNEDTWWVVPSMAHGSKGAVRFYPSLTVSTQSKDGSGAGIKP